MEKHIIIERIQKILLENDAKICKAERVKSGLNESKRQAVLSLSEHYDNIVLKLNQKKDQGTSQKKIKKKV